MDTTPRISAIMPTAGRRAFVPGAIAAFLAQTRQDAELIILDDGEQPAADLVPAHPRIRYVRQEQRRTVGAKRNALCEMAHGSVIVHWDDDDWHAPCRLARQLEALEAGGSQICGLGHIAFLAADGSGAWNYLYGGAGDWVYGASLAYRRSHWRARPFPELACGEDTQWILRAPRGTVHVLADSPETLLVARIHPGNTSTKRTQGSWWKPRDPAPLLALTTAPASAPAPVAARAEERADLAPARAASAAAAALHESPEAAPVRPLANVYACLVHERPECVIDLVRNLRHLDPVSPILLYDGSASGDLLDPRLPWARWGVEPVPGPRPMHWGTLHGFALDCIAHLGARAYDTLTIVDSDQLMLKPGYREHLARRLSGPVGILSPDPRPQGPATSIPPACTAQQERELWLPFLRRFAGGEDKFVYWTFWPGTVIGADAARAIAALFQDPQLTDILARSKLWATEEILFPTLAALLGFEVAANPCAQDWVKYRRNWTGADIDRALARPDAFFVHPVERTPANALRTRIRAAHGDYRPAAPLDPDRVLIDSVRDIEGWLADEEASLLIASARAAIARPGAAGRIVEIGSFCGKATVLLARAAPGAIVQAVDRFDGVAGTRDARLDNFGPTRERFERAIAAHGVADRVEVHCGEAGAHEWRDPVDLLLVDGLHDYAAVAGDFAAFEALLAPGALAAFHDYAEYFPGVIAFVDELLASGEWLREARAGSLIVLRRQQFA